LASTSPASHYSSPEMPSKELTLDGITYKSYEEYVAAKRQRNQEMLQKSGLLEAKHAISTSIEKEKAKKVTRGIKRRPEKKEIAPRRKSSRLAGIVAENIFVEKETNRGFEVSGLDYKQLKEEEKERFYGNRVNDGSDLSTEDAASLPKAKWLSDTAVEDAVSMCKSLPTTTRPNSPKSVITSEKSLISKINKLRIDNENQAVKIVPERIYSTTFHPSKLLACAGDKIGHLGLWNIDAESSETNGVSLFKPHSGAISSLEWNCDGSALYSLSYDNTIRALDVNTQSFNTIFATYDSDSYKNKPGYYPDDGSWIQYGCLHENGYFMSTSYGDVLHLDLRSKQVTFSHNLDEKKINTLSIHNDGYSMVTAGLSRTIQLFDIRKLGKKNKAIASHSFSKSVNSAFFSPSGTHLLVTTMNDTIEIYKDFQLKQPHRRINHNNQTGRWLTTFQAKWHPTEDIFCAGSMNQPRGIEVFNPNGIVRCVRGDMLQSVASRCCFWGGEELMVLGGNSSGKAFLLR